MEVIATANIEFDPNTQRFNYDLSGSVPLLTVLLAVQEVILLIQEAVAAFADGGGSIEDIDFPLANAGLGCIASLDDVDQGLANLLDSEGPPILNSFAEIGLNACSTCFFEVDVNGNDDIGTNDVGSDPAVVVNIGSDGVIECTTPSALPSVIPSAGPSAFPSFRPSAGPSAFPSSRPSASPALSLRPTIGCPETSSSKGMMMMKRKGKGTKSPGKGTKSPGKGKGMGKGMMRPHKK